MNNDNVQKNILDETTTDNIINDPEYAKWVQDLNNAITSNDSITQRRLLRDRILLSPEFSENDKKLFSTVYDYIEKIISQNKPLETNLLKIYLQDLHGYDIDNIQIMRILCLVALCGFTFSNL